MVKKRGMPSSGELVLCKVEKINPHSAYLSLEEYGLQGMVHVSEVSSGWVKDIRNHLKIGQTVIAKVIRIDERGMSLSIKRVDEKQRKDKIRESKFEEKAEKMLELAASKLGKTLEQAYEEAGYLLQEKFGSIYEGFKRSLSQDITERGIPLQWASAIKDIAEKSIEQKEFEFRAKLFVKTYKPNGINIVKNILLDVEKKGLEVKYIAAPEYLVRYKTKNAKQGEKLLLDTLSKLSGDAEIKFEIIE
jgi:translation initiation factor 2 subunit 1